VRAVRIRPAAEADYEIAGAICVAAYDADNQIVGDYAEELADVASRAAISEVLVAEDAETLKVVGTVTFVRPGTPLAELAREDEAEFRMLGVDPSARGRGMTGPPLTATSATLTVSRRAPLPRRRGAVSSTSRRVSARDTGSAVQTT